MELENTLTEMGLKKWGKSERIYINFYFLVKTLKLKLNKDYYTELQNKFEKLWFDCSEKKFKWTMDYQNPTNELVLNFTNFVMEQTITKEIKNTHIISEKTENVQTLLIRRNWKNGEFTVELWESNKLIKIIKTGSSLSDVISEYEKNAA